MRRVAQCYVIATKTKLDISGVQVPDHIDDAYFKRQKKPKKTPKKEDSDIFAYQKKVCSRPSYSFGSHST